MQAPSRQPPERCDLAVVGAGIVGLAVAREALRRRPGATVCVFEREGAVGLHQTTRNSGVVHGGIYYRPGSLKARLCVEGARELYAYCEGRGIAAVRCGKLIVASDARELARLDELERRGRANGVPGLRRLDGRGLREVEPHARGVAALHSPATGVVDFAEVARALAGDVQALGGTVVTGCAVRRLGPGRGARGEVEIEHALGRTRARRAVACAGPWSDRLATASGAPADPRVVPFRGAWLRLRPERAALVRALIYPVPDPRLPFLGVHLSRHRDEVLVGPTALLAPGRDALRPRRALAGDLAATLAWPGTWRMARRFWRAGAGEVARAASRAAVARAAARLVPEIGPGDLLPGFAGVRAQALGRDGTLIDDFVVSEQPGVLHVRNAPSPAATASLALARLICDRLEADAPLPQPARR